MAPPWAKILVSAAFAVSSAEYTVACEQECDHEVLLLQVATQFKKHKAAQSEIEVDDSVLMQTEAQVIEGAGARATKAKAMALFAPGSSLLAPRSREVKAYFERRRQPSTNQKTPNAESVGSESRDKAAAVLTNSSLAPRAPEVRAYFERRARQRAMQQPVAQPSASGPHGLASMGSLGSIFAPNDQVSEYLKIRALEKARPSSAAAPISSLTRRTASSLGALSGSILAPKGEEIRAYMKRRKQQKMIQKMQHKYRTVVMAVPASGEPQAVIEDQAALNFKDEFAAAAISVGAAAVVGVVAVR